MNDTDADHVRAMYASYPFPSPIVGNGLIYDVGNLMLALLPESQRAGRRILDAGCGTGQRLVGMATKLPDSSFVGIDFTERSLGVAAELAKAHGATNVRFERQDLLDLHMHDRFDIIVSAGVIHHLTSPEQGLVNLSRCLTDDGVLVLWYYHAYGEFERLLHRDLVRTLWGSDRSDLDEGLRVLRDVGVSLDDKQYGSGTALPDRDAAQISIDADAYLHPIVNAYTFDQALAMFARCDVDWGAVNGINMPSESKLIDLDGVTKGLLASLCVDETQLFPSEFLQRKFRALSKPDRLRVIELAKKPTGFTVLAGRGDSYRRFGERIQGNVTYRRSGG